VLATPICWRENKMQQYNLTIEANARPETLERLLRVVRHRGFEVLDLNAQKSEQILTLNLKLQSTRAISLLTTQLEKLFDVTKITR
jgi:acetolactate synthase 2 regulatory subunit